MIIAYVGLPGSGKTYHMTAIALDLIKRGKIVFSRHQIEGAYPLVDEREMLYMSHCHVFFDEWHQDHEAKKWWDMDEVTRHVVTQSRKYSITIHWSAQHWKYMDTFIRRNTDFAWSHTALFRNPDTGESKINLHRALKFSGLDMERDLRNPKPLERRFIFIRKRVFQAYDSYKPIMLSKEKLTDEDILKIKDPFSRERIKLPPYESRNQHPYLIRDENRLDAQPYTDHDCEGIKRQQEANELRSDVKITNPL